MKGNGNGLLRKSLLGLAMLVLVMLFSASCGGSDSPQAGGTLQPAQSSGVGSGTGSGGDAEEASLMGGQWAREGEAVTWEFFPDGRLIQESDEWGRSTWTWSSTGGRLLVTITQHSTQTSQTFSYSISGDTMTVTNDSSGETSSWTRSR